MKNIAYHTSFENFFRKLFHYFRTLPEESLPVEPQYAPYAQQKNEHGFNLINLPDFRLLIERHFNEFSAWKEYSELSDNVILMGQYGQVWNDKDGSHYKLNYIPSVVHTLYGLFNNSFRYKKKIADDFYAQVESCLYEEDWIFSICAPVYNLELEQGTAEITGESANLRLKKIDRNDLLLFVPSVSHHGFGVNAYTPLLRTMIVTEESHKKGEPSQIGEETQRLFRRVVAALSIHQRQKFELGPFYAKPKNFWPFLGGTLVAYMPDEIHTHHENKRMGRKDIAKFRSFWRVYEPAVSKNAWIELASQRMLRLFYEMRQEDSIVDMMTILEILYLPESDAELKYRLSTRCATVLAPTFDLRKEVYDIVKLSYDVRSNIVHSGAVASGTSKKLLKAGLNLHDLCMKLQEYIYISLETFARNPSLRNQLEALVLQ
ncbi:hypothetical protein PITCH_A1660005 [uncultured Desulfobacterium sp.]|uniref:Uncharacterized protein n=1 Tax=uncultured Desulfobacterium sp. TaxID=201089 RepID=A0A445MU82_9BACT|nr:hypothetical protein PITCH_A1660005 [uncultured Desulfobacterium sp.]